MTAQTPPSSAPPPSDLDLMLFADGELGDERVTEVEAYLAANPDARLKLEGLSNLGEIVRTYSEIETDAAEESLPAFGGLWERVERRIHANGAKFKPVSAESGPGEDVPLNARERSDASEGFWASLKSWFGEHRGHMVTGLVGAGAACALMLAVGPREKIIETKTVQVGGGTAVAMPVAALESEPPEIEDLEVYEGSGTILTIEAEGDDDSSAAVIWISNNDEDNMEDPI